MLLASWILHFSYLWILRKIISHPEFPVKFIRSINQLSQTPVYVYSVIPSFLFVDELTKQDSVQDWINRISDPEQDG